jgi:hypothetical protein
MISNSSFTLNYYQKKNLMARPLRVEYPGAYYHVIDRGNAGENIFMLLNGMNIFQEKKIVSADVVEVDN